MCFLCFLGILKKIKQIWKFDHKREILGIQHTDTVFEHRKSSAPTNDQAHTCAQAHNRKAWLQVQSSALGLQSSALPEAREECSWPYYGNSLRVYFMISRISKCSRVLLNSINRLVNIEKYIEVLGEELMALYGSVIWVYFFPFYFIMKMFSVKLICNQLFSRARLKPYLCLFNISILAPLW